MIRARALLRFVAAAFGEGTVFPLAANREPNGLEMQLLLFLAESGQRIVALCPGPALADAGALARYRAAVEKRLPESDRATLGSPQEFLGYALPFDVYRRWVRQPEDWKSKLSAPCRAPPRPASGPGHPTCRSAQRFARHFSLHVPSAPDAARGWRSDKACLERTLDADQLCWRGTWLHGRFKYREARRYLLQVPRGHRDAGRCQLLLADAYRREGQFVREAETYEQLLRLSPDPHVSLLHAISLVRSGRVREALPALASAPGENANTHYYGSLCAAAAGDFAAAARHAREACRLAPDSAEAAYRRLSCCWRAGAYLQIPQALVAFWKASAMTAPEPLELVDLPNVRAAGECAQHRAAARVRKARGEAWRGRRAAVAGELTT